MEIKSKVNWIKDNAAEIPFFLFSQAKGEQDYICFVHMSLTLISVSYGLFMLFEHSIY